MKTVAITVHNNKKLEIFVERRENGFEFWAVAPIRGQRVVLGHHLTHDDVEAHLHYARPGDLAWRDGEPSEIPAKKHRGAIEDEGTIRQGTFWDYDDPQFGPFRNVANHLGAIAFLSEDIDKTEWSIAEQAMLGKWTDGVVTISLEPDHKLGWSCADRQHPLNVGERVNGHPPDWWNFSMWGIAFLNSEHKCGTRTGVLRVNEKELHLTSRLPHRIADVFQRIGPPVAGQQPERAAPPKRRGRVSGVATPLIRRLEKAITHRNPLVVDRLKPGLAESDIRQALNRANLAGAIEPVIELYSWRNGTALDESTPMEEASFFPKDIYQFMDLQTAIKRWKSMNQAGAQLREMVQGTEASGMFDEMTSQLFPLFSDGGTGAIAVDLTPSKQNRVVAIEFESDEPVRQAYGSFKDFITDVIRANREERSLSCFQ